MLMTARRSLAPMILGCCLLAAACSRPYGPSGADAGGNGGGGSATGDLYDPTTDPLVNRPATYLAQPGDEAAIALGVSRRKVAKDWSVARLWLIRELNGQ